MPNNLGQGIVVAEPAKDIMKILPALLFACSLFAATPDTDTAAWITAQGGRAATDAAGHVIAANLGSTWITDVDLQRIGDLAYLRELDLSHTMITDVGLEHLKNLRRVTTFSLYYAEYFSDSGIAHLADWKSLEHLDLHGTKVTSKVFEHIARLTGLKSLDIAFTQIDDDGFENLSALTNLQHLAIGGNRLNGSGLASLKLLPALTSLDVGGVQWVDSGTWGLPLTEANLRQIGALKQLKSLSLNGANITDRGADKPGQAESIRTELKGLNALSGLVNLEMLDLSRTPVSAESLEPLRALPKLHEIRLGMAPNINDSAVPVLAQMKNLKAVYIAGTKISDTERAKIPAR
jgi:internalin A